MSRRVPRKERVGEIYAIFYGDKEKRILDEIDRITEETGCKKRQILIDSLEYYLFYKNTDR